MLTHTELPQDLRTQDPNSQYQKQQKHYQFIGKNVINNNNNNNIINNNNNNNIINNNNNINKVATQEQPQAKKPKLGFSIDEILRR